METTRRNFIGTGACAAGAAMFSGCISGDRAAVKLAAAAELWSSPFAYIRTFAASTSYTQTMW